MECAKDAVALLTFSPPQAKAWLYDLIDANPATGIMLCRRHANATVVPMSWQLVDSRDPSWAPPGEPAMPQQQPASIPGLLSEESMLTEPLVEPMVVAQPAPILEPAMVPEPAMATVLSSTIHRDVPPPPMPGAEPQALPPHAAPAMAPALEQQPASAQRLAPNPTTVTYQRSEPAAVTPTVTAPSPVAAMPAAPMVGTAATAVVAPPMPDPHLEPPVARIPMRVDARVDERFDQVVSLNDQIASHARTVAPVAQPQQWAEAHTHAGPPAAADLVANIQERLLPDPSLFELPLDAPAVTPHNGYR